MTTRPSQEIVVSHFRQILIWPLLLKTSAEPAERPQFDQWLDLLKPAWGKPCPLRRGDSFGTRAAGDDPDAPDHDEIVYFHPFVRDFLYGDGKDDPDERTLFRLRRSDVKQARVVTADSDGKSSGCFTFNVPRVELYLCKPLVALLVFEIAWPHPCRGQTLTLNDVLKLQSQFRQAFAPFFKPNGDLPEVAGNCPVSVSWLDSGGNVLARSDFDGGRESTAEVTRVGAEPPVAAHWSWLLKPLTPYRSAASEKSERRAGYYQQILDDRIPGLSFIAVDEPRDISQGDFDRLTFCDLGGDAPFPFSEDFLEPERAGHRYDRFWRKTDDHDQPFYEFTTRYLCSGYQMVIVGRTSNGFFTNTLLNHFRNHYFRLGLILHYQRAALLKFQDEMAEAVKLLRRLEPSREFGNQAFHDRVTYIQMTFLKFRTRSRFAEVTNQLQGRELFDFWAGRLRNDLIFQQADDTSQKLYTALAEFETRRLTRFASYGVPVSLALSVLSVLYTILGASGNVDSGRLAVWSLLGLLLAVVTAFAFWVCTGMLDWMPCLRAKRLRIAKDFRDWFAPKTPDRAAPLTRDHSPGDPPTPSGDAIGPKEEERPPGSPRP